jgi:putative membrane protein
MTDRGRNKSEEALQPRIFTVEASKKADPGAEPISPRITATAETGRIVPSPAKPPQGSAPRRRRRYGLTMKLGMTGLVVAFCAWLVIDLYLWVVSAFENSAGLGWAALAAAATGLVAALAMIVHELRSYLALKSVEANQQRLAAPVSAMRPADMQAAIREVIAEIPKDRETQAAIEAFQRSVQPHHSPAQQIELLSRTVMPPLDRRAEAIIRRMSTRAFGITAISPTAIIDALFFIATSIRMVRQIAACYGHRPTALATVHLLRRLLVEAGKLGAVDLAGAALTQHIGGAVAERVAASAAESMYATQRMARLGLAIMGLCRPVPFRPGELPGLWSTLTGSLFARRGRQGLEQPESD